MSNFAGTTTLALASARRDRVRMVGWVVGLVGVIGLGASGVQDLFPTQADLDQAAELSANPAVRAFNGPDQGLDTLGGQVAFQLGASVLTVTALMALLMVVRATRGEEESGRMDLIRSLPVGRHASLAAATIVVTIMAVSVGTLATIVLVSQALPGAGAVSLGVSYALIALVFGAIGLVAAQITANTRLAGGIGGGVLGAAFVIRAIGDAGSGTASWLSPIGWMQKARPFADERWAPFLLGLGAVAVLMVIAAQLGSRRDLGAGLIAPQPGPAQASSRLAGPISLELRTQRGALLGWVFGIAMLGISYGSIATTIEDFVRDNGTMAEMFIGDSTAPLIDSYLATSTRIVALVGAGFATQSMIRARQSETSGRVGLLLAASVSRTRWMLAHVVVAAGGGLAVLLAGGAALAVSAGISTGENALVLDVIASSVAYYPAVAIMIGTTGFLTGLWPRVAPAAWLALIGSIVLTVMGPLLGLPEWAEDLSPFTHIPLMPAESFDPMPLIVESSVAIALTATGLLGIRRRDVD